jgi:Domain of unknown function (DUF4389)
MPMTWSCAATPGSRPSRSRRSWPDGWSREGWRSTTPKPGSFPFRRGSISSGSIFADLNRWLPLVKWLLAIPHYIVLFFLDIVAFFVVIAAWFAIMFTGRYPRGMFSFVEGVFRWHNRVVGYAFTLVTDRYPPFRLAP